MVSMAQTYFWTEIREVIAWEVKVDNIFADELAPSLNFLLE